MGNRFEEHDFEVEVLRISRSLWPFSEYSGSEMVEGRERDGIFETEECHHFVEATVSKSSKKAYDDCFKLVELLKKRQRINDGKGTRGWFITQDEPTADQRSVLNNPKLKDFKSSITMMSFSQFQSKIIDVRNYFSLRDIHSFGSVRDPATDALVPQVDYVDLDYVDAENQEIYSIDKLSNSIIHGDKVVILGDYGSGKSMTIRHLYHNLKDSYRKGNTSKFPIAINLREHMGSNDPSDILEKHAKIIGYSRPDHLVRAWKLGYAIILLDGFDEIAPYGINGAWKRLKEIRKNSLLPIKKFLDQKPDSGYIISGRLHYISDNKELRNALGTTSDTKFFSLNEFTDEQVRRYLSRISNSIQLPEWIPNKPLFIGHLAAGGIIAEIAHQQDENFIADISYGWNSLLNMICQRESKIDGLLIDGETVRRIIERLSTYAREYSEGLGPLTKEVIKEVYEDVCQYPFEEKATVLIQRFPGLGMFNQQDESRKFIDSSFADVCRAGDLIRYIENPYQEDAILQRKLECSIGPVAVPLVNDFLKSNGISEKQLSSQIEKFSSLDQQILKYDIFQCMLEGERVPFSYFTIENIQINELDLSSINSDLSKVSFHNCLIDKLVLSNIDTDDDLYPLFYNCIIDHVSGRLSKGDLPVKMFDEKCETLNFTGNIQTNSGIREADLPPSIKVLIIILKKLFIQSLSGRKEKALYAGLELTDRRLVPDIISILERNELIVKYRKSDGSIWLPVKSSMSRAMEIMNNPNVISDAIIEECRKL